MQILQPTYAVVALGAVAAARARITTDMCANLYTH